jgi:hypothetical protein
LSAQVWVTDLAFLGHRKANRPDWKDRLDGKRKPRISISEISIPQQHSAINGDHVAIGIANDTLISTSQLGFDGS